MEVDLVWKSKWSLMKGLYLFQRYSPFIDTVWLVLYRQPHASLFSFPDFFFLGQTGANLTRTGCRNIFLASGGS